MGTNKKAINDYIAILMEVLKDEEIVIIFSSSIVLFIEILLTSIIIISRRNKYKKLVNLELNETSI